MRHAAGEFAGGRAAPSAQSPRPTPAPAAEAPFPTTSGPIRSRSSLETTGALRKGLRRSAASRPLPKRLLRDRETPTTNGAWRIQ